uniref:BEN domain-containing protein n=1 Tax=Glossina palpalis gambiensis TaxID=67801 RepID=A0A1B0C0N0_9MUSC
MSKTSEEEDLVTSGHRAFAAWNPIFSLESPLRVRMKVVDELNSNFIMMDELSEQQKLDEALEGLVRKCEGFRKLNYCSSEQGSSSGVSSLAVTPPLDTINDYSDRSVANNVCTNQDMNAIKDDSDSENSCSDEYPMRTVNDDGVEMVIIGNYDTRIPAKLFDTILWSSAASATRQLLGFIFSDDELATHTLTGKPSPAFHGRQRPPKSQLSPDKVADVISIVQAKCSCNERVVRAAITTKCSDTARKYKRQSKKNQTI